MITPLSSSVLLAVGVLAASVLPAVRAADWPPTGTTRHARPLPPRFCPPNCTRTGCGTCRRCSPAWPDQAVMQFDAAYAPVVAGRPAVRRLAARPTPSPRTTPTPAPRSGGSPPTARSASPRSPGRTGSTSSRDDGYLYCVEADDRHGSLWKFRGGPADRKILGNGRLISTVAGPRRLRSSPTARSTSPPASGRSWASSSTPSTRAPARSVWTNDGDGSHLHEAAAPGRLVRRRRAAGRPGGHRRPAAGARRPVGAGLLRPQDRQAAALPAGRQLQGRRRLRSRGGRRHCSSTAATVFDAGNRHHLGPAGEHVVLDGDVLYAYGTGSCRSFDLKSTKLEAEQVIDRKTIKTHACHLGRQVPARRHDCPSVEAMIRPAPASTSATAGRSGRRTAACRERQDRRPSPGRRRSRASRSLCSRRDGRLFVVTLEGHGSTASAPSKAKPKTFTNRSVPPPTPGRGHDCAHAILDATGPRRLLRRLGRRLRPAGDESRSARADLR